jgi:tetratricopeptide (TPR) repeat protein
MLATMREYALDRLEDSGEAERLRRRHARYVLALAEEAEPHLRFGGQQVIWLERLEQEKENSRVALSWLGEAREQELELRLAGALGRFWWMHSYWEEGRRALEAALRRRDPSAELAKARAKALLELGAIAGVLQCDFARAKEALGESLELCRASGDRKGEAMSLHRLGMVANRENDYALAMRLAGESAELAREIGDSWWLAISLGAVGLYAWGLDDSSRAVEATSSALRVFRELRDERNLAVSLLWLGEWTLHEGELARAEGLLQEGLELARALGERAAAAGALSALARCAFASDDPVRARQLYGESLPVFADLGDTLSGAWALEGVADLEVGAGQPLRAARLLGAAEALREQAGSRRAPADQRFYDRVAADAVRQADEGSRAEAWSRGRAMTLEEAVAYAPRSLADAPDAVLANPVRGASR